MAMILYAATLVLSSSLLFFVQPMVGKMVLPLLGGTPAVWNTCMVFFQAALLAGYAYAHGTTARFGVRKQAVLHLILLAVPILVLPIGLRPDASPPPEGNPIGWLLLSLATSVGLPFFVVAASAPLLQKWFERTGHPSGHDPYFLYAASNVGSLGALLAYPVLVEPHLSLAGQTTAWAIGYGLLIVAFIVCAVTMWRSEPHAAASPLTLHGENDASPGIPWKRRLHWIFLAAVPSSLMLGVTTHVTTNVAAVPLLWVVPLAVYLLTFILVFSRRTVLPHAWMVRGLPFLVVILGPLFFAPPQELGWVVIPLHIAVFFVAAMVCHGELARDRPTTRHLTEFYLMMSIGGVLGGLFNAMAAPAIFDSVVEYPLAVIAACMLMPRGADACKGGAWWLDLVMPVGLGMIAAALVTGMMIFNVPVTYLSMMIAFFVPALLCFQFKNRPVRFALAFAAVLLVTGFYSRSSSGDVQYVERNFFGVKKVMYSPDHKTRLLAHGTTNHGCESLDPATAGEPLAYFHRHGPLGDVFKIVTNHDLKKQIAIIGLGVGSIAAYLEPGERATYYEIDPAVERIARDRAYFSFLSHCRGDVDVVLGDGRLTLARAPDKQYGMLILDAFSSDAIPTHLLSLEAARLYLSKLRDDGLLVFHISNGFLNLEPVVARLAEALGLACVSRSDRDLPRGELAEGQFAAHYVVMSRNAEALKPLLEQHGAQSPSAVVAPRWLACQSPRETPVWTDQYCDILGTLRLPRPSREPNGAQPPSAVDRAEPKTTEASTETQDEQEAVPRVK